VSGASARARCKQALRRAHEIAHAPWLLLRLLRLLLLAPNVLNLLPAPQAITQQPHTIEKNNKT
jgi:hypothetical protein